MFQGCTTENVQKAFDDLNEIGFDLGGAGPALRTSTSCVGHARCEMSCYDEVKAHRSVHQRIPRRDASSGAALQVQVQVLRLRQRLRQRHPSRRLRRDRHLARRHEGQPGRGEGLSSRSAAANTRSTHVISMCPTRALSLNDDDTLDVDNKSCVRCMHCLNVMNKALSPGDDRGASILIGGKRALKVGDLMGIVIVPFIKLETDEDYEKLVAFGRKPDRLLRRERAGARAHRRDHRPHRPARLPRGDRGRSGSRTWSIIRAPPATSAPTTSPTRRRNISSARRAKPAERRGGMSGPSDAEPERPTRTRKFRGETA